uniref:Uncharacterized protein n=1 Tax=Lotus japonicus TaxID=34305 RepID=I3SQ95_LOTJA|nr:unknown [Lotus japonicus]
MRIIEELRKIWRAPSICSLNLFLLLGVLVGSSRAGIHHLLL